MDSFIESGGVKLHVQVDGEAGKPWLMLSNSLAADLTMWDGQIDGLTKHHRVLRYDTRGHGKSEAPAGDYSFPMLIGDVIAILDFYGIGKTAFMGLSLGGMTALGLALTHPERLTRIVVCDARADTSDAINKGWDERLGLLEAGGMHGILEGTLGRWIVPDTRTRDPALVERISAMILRTSPLGWAGCAAALKTLDYAKSLHAITVPALFVGGEHDGGANPDVMGAMAAAVPGAGYRKIANAAHLANLDNPADFAAAVEPFLSAD